MLIFELYALMKKPVMRSTPALLLFVLLAIFSTSGQAQTVVIKNCIFDASASTNPPAWLVWNNGVAMAG